VRGAVIAGAALGGFVVAFGFVQLYMWPEWHLDDCGELECLGPLILSVYLGALGELAVAIIAGFTAWLATRRRAAVGSPSDEST
jgi:ABC-type Fe3+ transport system permease subunit